jgi:hypothetical protein
MIVAVLGRCVEIFQCSWESVKVTESSHSEKKKKENTKLIRNLVAEKSGATDH